MFFINAAVSTPIMVDIPYQMFYDIEQLYDIIEQARKAC